MPVKVTKKAALQSVAKAPTPSPNKEDSIKVKVKDLCYPSIADMGKYKGALVLNPVIDWLEFGSSVPKADLAELEDGFKSLMHHEEAIKVLSPMEKLGVPKSKGYGFAGFWTGTAKEDGHVLIKFAPAKQQSRYFVICMNPSQMTAVELEAFWTFWDELFPYHPYLHRKALLAAPETILRVDIAVDLLGVEPQSVVASKQAGKSVKKKVQIAYQSVSGRLETKYGGTRSGTFRWQSIWPRLWRVPSKAVS